MPDPRTGQPFDFSEFVFSFEEAMKAFNSLSDAIPANAFSIPRTAAELPVEIPSRFHSSSSAIAFLRQVVGDRVPAQATTKQLLRAAKRHSHPDTGGDALVFNAVVLAEEYLTPTKGRRL